MQPGAGNEENGRPLWTMMYQTAWSSRCCPVATVQTGCEASIRGRGRRLLPLRQQRRAIEFRAVQVHVGNPPRVEDIRQRVRVEDDEVGLLAAGEHADVVAAEELGRPDGCQLDGLRDR